jgi:hypothetical protein
MASGIDYFPTSGTNQDVGLLTLAVDIMLQHRDIPIDEYKRRQSWTYKLRQVAQFEIEMTPQEQYSSSRNPAFSALMKQRAEKDILPSLFDVSQSYEDHVVQYGLWTYADIKDTEPDDTMYKLAAQIMRRKEAREARRKAKVPTSEVLPTTRASSVEPTSREATIEAPSPTVLGRRSISATPQPSAQQVSSLDDTKSAMSSSFDQSMNHLRLQDDGNGAFRASEGQGRVARLAAQSCEQSLQYNAIPVRPTSFSQIDQEDVKGGSFDAPADGAQRARCRTQGLEELIHEHMQFQTSQAGLANSSYHPLQTAGPCAEQKAGGFLQYTPHHFVDPAQLSMFNNSYSLQMDHAYDHSVATNSMPMSYPYESNALYHNMDVMSTAASPQAPASFNGLPYEYPGPQH